MLAKAGVPLSHILIADNYMVIKKVYGTPVVKSRISVKDKALLASYDFNQLEYTTIKQINEELELLKKWSLSQDEKLKSDSDRILEIRLNELKYLTACRYTLISNELYSGYMALEKYFEDISKYSIWFIKKCNKNHKSMSIYIFRLFLSIYECVKDKEVYYVKSFICSIANN